MRLFIPRFPFLPRQFPFLLPLLLFLLAFAVFLRDDLLCLFKRVRLNRSSRKQFVDNGVLGLKFPPECSRQS